MDVAEVPVGVDCDEGGNELSSQKSNAQQGARPLQPRERLRARDEDERLADDGNLQQEDCFCQHTYVTSVLE